MKSKLLAILVFLPALCFCQDLAVSIPATALTVKKYPNEKLVIPVEIQLEMPANAFARSNDTTSVTLAAKISMKDLPNSLMLPSSDEAQIRLEPSSVVCRIPGGNPSVKTKVFIIVPPNVSIVSNKALVLELSIANNNSTPTISKQIFIEPATDVIYSLDNYLDKKIKIETVVKVESLNNILTVSGYKGDGFTKRQVLLERGQALLVRERSAIFTKGYFNSGPLSLISVPFKVRPRIKVNLFKGVPPNDTIYQASAMSGITNLGVNIDIVKFSRDRYFSSGKKSSHKFGIGVLITPGVEELSAATVKDQSLTGDKKSKQLYISGGISLFYSYNGITLFAVPAAVDIAPSSVGQQWIYSGKYWWGFGIGVSPIVFAQAFNTK